MKIVKNVKYYINTSIVAACTFLMGIYVMLHLNYLDDPRITPFPPPLAYREGLGFTDDLWFACLLLAVSTVIMIGVACNRLKIIVPGMLLLLGIYCAITIEFAIRGVFTPHYNISWVACLTVACLIYHLLFKLGKGGGRDQ